MAEERFDCVVVGGGPAGAAAAYTMAKAGLKVALIDRGEFPGAKNVFGGVLFRSQLEDLLPEFWKEAPLERLIVEERLMLLDEQGMVTLSHRNPGFADPPNSWSAMRAQFDAWFAGKAEKAGAVPVYQTTVTELLQEGDRVVGVRTDREDGDLYADIVIVADGVNSLLGKALGVHREWQPDEVSLGVKEIIHLPRNVIESRFNLEGNEGASIEFLGDTLGMTGLGFLYTNKESISIGVGIMVNDLQKARVKPYAVLDHVKQHPYIRKLIAGGEVEEYAAHLIPEGGFHSMPPLAGNGWMICGDAAQMVNAVNGEGTNLAVLSGRLAGETAILAHVRGDYSLGMLDHYNEAIRASIVFKDLKKYSGIHGLLSGPERRVLFGKLPGVLNEAISQYMSVDGTPKRDKQKLLIKQLRDAAGGNMELLRLGLKGWRAINR